MNISTYEDSFSGDRLQTVIDGKFDPSDVKRAARAFAVIADREAVLEDRGPAIRVFIEGRGWEDPDGLPVTFRRKKPVKKIGRKYFHVEVDGELDRVKRKFNPRSDSDRARATIRSNDDSYDHPRTEL